MPDNSTDVASATTTSAGRSPTTRATPATAAAATATNALQFIGNWVHDIAADGFQGIGDGNVLIDRNEIGPVGANPGSRALRQHPDHRQRPRICGSPTTGSTTRATTKAGVRQRGHHLHPRRLRPARCCTRTISSRPPRAASRSAAWAPAGPLARTSRSAGTPSTTSGRPSRASRASSGTATRAPATRRAQHRRRPRRGLRPGRLSPAATFASNLWGNPRSSPSTPTGTAPPPTATLPERSRSATGSLQACAGSASDSRTCSWRRGSPSTTGRPPDRHLH